MGTQGRQLPVEEIPELFRIITENVDDLIAVLDLDGKRLYNSPSYKQIFGDVETLRGTDSFHEIHPDDREAIRALFRRTVATGAGSRAEYRFMLPDGTIRHVESQGNLIRDAKGAPRFVVVVARDLTERRQSESKVRLLAHALSSTRDGFALTDLEGRILFVNPAFGRAYGYAEAELAGKNIAVTYGESNPQRLLDEIIPATVAGGWNGEILGVRKNGEEFPLEIWTSPVPDEQGAPVALVSIARDITDRRRTTELLLKGEQRFRSLIENSSDGIALLTRDGIAIYFSSSTRKILGYSDADLVGTNVLLIVHPDDRAGVEQLLQRLTELPAEPASGHYRVKHKDGSWRWLESISTNLLQDPGVGAIVVNFRDVTDRKMAEELLRENEAKYRLLFDANPEAMWVYDHETTKIVAVNDAAITRYGFSRTEFTAMSVRDLLAPPSPARGGGSGPRISADPAGNVLTVRHTRKDGSAFDVEIITHPILFAGRQADLVIAKDVTERKRVEELQEAVYRISLAADRSPNLETLFRELHGIISTVMPAGNFYIALYDEKTDMLSFPYFVDEVDVPSPPQKLGRGLTEYVLRTGKSLLVDKETDEELKRHGEVELVGVSSPIWLGVPLLIDNTPIGVMTVQHYSDPLAYGKKEQQVLEFVSSQVAKAIDKKRSEDALRESEMRYRNLFEQNPTGIYRTTPQGRVVMANPTLLRMLGYASMEEIAAIDIETHGVESPYERSRFRELVDRDGEVRGLEASWLKKDGSVIFVRENARAIRDAAGSVVYYEGTVEDITERKRLEQQLQQAQKMEGIGTLAGGIAHDFNNLLGIILGYTQLLEGGTVSPERYAKSLDTIKKAVERGAELVRQLLTFARKADPSFRPININEVVTDLSHMISETFSKSIAVALDLDERVPSIFADKTQLHQAILNLCVNARDAMLDPRVKPQPGGTLTLRTGTVPGYKLQQKYSKATSNEYVFVSVSDTGVGMDEATKKHIFEPFFTTKELGKGTGLGLAVVYGVINSHHGFTEFTSELGAGSTFSAYFPATLVEESVVELQVAPDLEEGHFTEKVLLVEDEEMLRDLLAGLLTAQGYEVLTAEDGQQGLEIYAANADSIALVLSDMGLPRLGGWEMFQKMKELNPGVKAILASGYFDPGVKMDLLKAGAKDFIQKPYIPDQILKRIREVIDDQTPGP
jgi:PAS domain S-box-containing protein